MTGKQGCWRAVLGRLDVTVHRWQLQSPGLSHRDQSAPENGRPSEQIHHDDRHLQRPSKVGQGHL